MPNKLKLVFSIVAIVAVFSVYELGLYVSRAANNGSALSADASSNVVQDDQNCPTCDPDHDGLTNAEELAWGTDPFNPDTDGDGFLDGEEVKSGHNPLIPGPNDLLSNSNLTQQFSQLAASGIYAGALNPASSSYAQSLSDIVSSVADSSKYTFSKTIDPSSFSVINSNTESEISYLKTTAPLIQQFGTLVGQQFKNLESNLNTIGAKGFGDTSVKAFFASQASAYQTILESGTAVSVPSVFKDSHLHFLTLVQQMQIISDSVVSGDSDPLKASVALNNLGDMYKNFVDLVGDYKDHIDPLNLDPSILNNILK